MMGPIIHIKATELKQIKISLSPSSKFKKKKKKTLESCVFEVFKMSELETSSGRWC